MNPFTSGASSCCNQQAEDCVLLISNNGAGFSKQISIACLQRGLNGQPFGGFNMSGTDSKAGGPDYLQLHMQAKSISEML